MRSSSFLVAAISIARTLVSAQPETPAELAAKMPACVLPCDTAAISSVGCGQTHYACHCAHSSRLATIATPCLENNSTCTAADLQAFGELIPQICDAVNATVNTTVNATASVSSTGALITTTPIAFSTSTLIPVTAGAEMVRVGRVSGLVFGGLGFVVGYWVL